MTQPNDSVNSTDAGDQLVLNSPEEAKSPKEFLLWAGVILLAAMTIYSPALFGKFLWDDDRHVEQNRNLRSAEGLANIWMKLGLPSGGTVQYYPLTHTTYWLEYQITGAKPGEIGTTIFHVDNVLLHTIAAILLWFVLRELALPGAWVVAAIWALHPIQAESVAWISERKNVLAAVFYFAATLAFLKSKFGLADPLEKSDPPKPKESKRDVQLIALYALSMLFFILAVLSKTIACSMPAVALLLIWWKRGRLTLQNLIATVPFFAIGIGMSLLTSLVERTQVGAKGPEWQLSIAQRILIASRAIWFYATKLICPIDLTFIYPRWDVNPSYAWQWGFCIALIVVLAALFVLRKKLGRGPLAASLIFCGVLVPALGFVNFYPMRYSFVADHFQYLAGPALIALVVAAIASVVKKLAASAKVLPYALAGVVLIVLCVLTNRQARIYASPVELWGDTVRKNPDSWMVRNSYGTSLWLASLDMTADQADQARKSLDEAMQQFAAALKLKPDHERAWSNWGQVLLLLSRPEEAADKFQHALQVNPSNIDALSGLARAQFDQKKFDDALATNRRALAAAEEQRQFVNRATAASIYNFMGEIFKAKGDLLAAADQYARAVDIDKNSAQYRYDYAMLLAKLNKKPEAAAQFGAAIEIRPDFIDPRIELAKLMISVGNLEGAQAQLKSAARISTTYPPLMDAAKLWSAAMTAREAATRPLTTRSATSPSITATKGATGAPANNTPSVPDITSETFSAPTTRPSR